MNDSMAPCAGCSRHVRVTDPACPFCGAAVTREVAARVVPPATMRLGRAAAFVFSSTLAVAACADSVGPGDAASDVARDGLVRDDGGSVALYGLPPADTGPGPADAGAPACDAGGNVALYGGPMPACPTDAGPDDRGGGMADYGAPPPRDN